MNLATKLALTISAVFALVLMASSALIATDEIAFVDEQTARHGRLLGRVVASTVEQTQEDHGQAHARELLREIDEHEEQIRIRWVDLDTAVDPRIDHDLTVSLRQGQTVTVVGGEGDDTLFTYAPLGADNDRHRRAIEISESLDARNGHVSGLQRLLLGIGLLGFGTSTLTAYWLGRRYVTRPVEEMVALARRVGKGDFSTKVPTKANDELGLLAQEMNQMSSDLERARKHATELEQARYRAQQQLEHAERLATVGQLAAGVAHEIGTPLQAISLRAGLIAARAGHIEGIEEFTRAIEVQSRRVAVIVRNLLSFARRKPPKTIRRDLREVVTDAISLIESAHPSTHIQIERQLPNECLLADADAEQLGHVITNLLVNGMHAMSQGGRIFVGVSRTSITPPPEVAPRRDAYACLWVEDEGTGISEDVLSHMFEPFFTTKPPGKGTGLGLSIVYGIVKEHGGWIDVQTQPGKGTRFTIYLPLAAPDERRM